MTGVFDSGVGGLCAFRILRRLLPRENLVFLRDRKNCPYGEKTRTEIIEIATANIRALTALGCEQVLIACCTASTVYDLLPEWARRAAIPITAPTVMRASELTRCGRVGVIATEATVRSHAFQDMPYGITVYEAAAQPLVSIIEGGECDGNITDGTEKYLKEILAPLMEKGVDTLILGCTHFHALRGEIERILSEGTKRIITVSSAEVGAEAAASAIGKGREGGRTVYI